MQTMHLKELDANLLVVLDALLMDASVTKAAERLGRSPSAVSHALSNLRIVFQDQLLVRAGQRLVPTAKALELAPTIHVIVSGMESLLRPSTPFDPATQDRSFVLACRDTCELTLLHELRRAIRAEAPNISIGWKSMSGASYQDELRLGRIQFVIAEGEPNAPAADFIWQHLSDEPYVTLASTRTALAGRKVTKRTFAEREHIFIAPPDGEPDPVQVHFEEHGLSPETTTRASSVFVGLFLALESDVLVTVPQSVARAVDAQFPLDTIKQPFPQLVVPTYLIWHRSLDRDECHEWVRERIIRLLRGESATEPSDRMARTGAC